MKFQINTEAESFTEKLRSKADMKIKSLQLLKTPRIELLDHEKKTATIYEKSRYSKNYLVTQGVYTPLPDTKSNLIDSDTGDNSGTMPELPKVVDKTANRNLKNK